MENNSSGRGKDSEVPTELQGWNWGAFMLNWIWGIGNNTYRAFWVLFPFVGFFMLFFLGLKGNEWAWRNRRWDSVEHFREVQRKWAKASLLVLAIGVLGAIALSLSLQSMFKDSEPYKLSLSMINSSSEVTARIGNPLEAGFISGSMQTSGPTGEAMLSYEVSGPSGTGDVAFEATKSLGSWAIDCLVVRFPASEEELFLGPCDEGT
jgi:hypothetical protein